MVWSYDNILPPEATAPSPAEIAAPRPVATPTSAAAMDNATLTREANALQAIIPQEFAEILSNPSLSPEQKIALAQELVQLNQSPRLSDQDIAGASPELREAAAKLKEHKDQIAAQEKQLVGAFIAPVAAIAGAVTAPAVVPEQQSPYGVTAERMPYEDLNKTYLTTTAYIASLVNGFPLQNVPDVRDRNRDLTV